MTGQADVGPQLRVALARYTAAGILDDTFGVNGKVIDTLAGEGGSIAGLRNYRGERVVAAVTVEQAGNDQDAGAARYLAD